MGNLGPVSHKWPTSKFLQYFYVAQQGIGIITEYQLLGHKTIHRSIIGYKVLDFNRVFCIEHHDWRLIGFSEKFHEKFTREYSIKKYSSYVVCRDAVEARHG